MTYFLDANLVIDILNGKKSVLENFKKCYAENTIKISDIAYYEIMRGFEYTRKKTSLIKFIAFVDKCRIEYQTKESLGLAAWNYANLRKNGKMIEDDDLLIGSLAVSKNAVLVTNNAEHLSRIENIRLENWAD